MKKVLFAVLLMLSFTFSIQATTVSASIVPEESVRYKEIKKALKAERSDEYAIDYYKDAKQDKDNAKLYKKLAKKITKGCKTDYEKAKAIYYWVSDRKNVRYDTDYYFHGKKLKVIDITQYEEYGYLQGVCEQFARFYQNLCQAVDIPTKRVEGYSYGAKGCWEGHVWNRVYVDGRWIHADTLFDDFDAKISSIATYYYFTKDDIKEQDRPIWSGTLVFRHKKTGQVLKTVKNIPNNSLLTSTYGYKAKQLYYVDDDFEYKPVKLNKLRINKECYTIYVDLPAVYTVKFNSNGGTKVKSVKIEYGTLPILSSLKMLIL